MHTGARQNSPHCNETRPAGVAGDASVACACWSSSFRPKHLQKASRQLGGLKPPVHDLPLLRTQDYQHKFKLKRGKTLRTGLLSFNCGK